jgi:hypothetical protein
MILEPFRGGFVLDPALRHVPARAPNPHLRQQPPSAYICTTPNPPRFSWGGREGGRHPAAAGRGGGVSEIVSQIQAEAAAERQRRLLKLNWCAIRKTRRCKYSSASEIFEILA